MLSGAYRAINRDMFGFDIGDRGRPGRCSTEPEEMFGIGGLLRQGPLLNHRGLPWLQLRDLNKCSELSAASLGKTQYLVLLLPGYSLVAFAAAAPPWALTRTIVRRALSQDAATPWTAAKNFFLFFCFFYLTYEIDFAIYYI